MKPSFRLTPRAYDDLKNIARYARQQWGEVQRERYMSALNERFHWLAERPRAGNIDLTSSRATTAFLRVLT